jgi:hypothetical protein
MIAVGVCGLGLMDSILVNAVSAGELVLWGLRWVERGSVSQGTQGV